MPVYYFPDANVLVGYFEEFDEQQYPLIFDIIEKTGHKEFAGYRVNGVAKEFDRITNENQISTNVEDAIRLLRENKSRPNFLKKIENMDYYPSQRIVKGLIKHNLAKDSSFDLIKVEKMIHQLFFEIKRKRNIILNRIPVAQDEKLEIVKKDYQIAIANFSLELNKLFPIIEEKDKNDNAHILNSVIFCVCKKIQGTFLTNDKLRLKNNDLEKATVIAQKNIKEKFGITLTIENVLKFHNKHMKKQQ